MKFSNQEFLSRFYRWERIVWHVFFLCVLSAMLACQKQAKRSNIPSKSPREVLGDWYTTHRHLKFQEQSPELVDAYNGPKGSWEVSYHIDAVDYHSARIFFFTLTPVDENSPPFQRMFVLSRDAKNMREFLGKRIIQWSRSP